MFPKRCGHIAGKTIIPLEEAVGKYRAAVDTRDRLNPDFVIIARTDAFGAVGGSLEEAIRRGRAYADAGVDLVWPELSSADRGPAVAFAKAMRESHPNLPLAFNYSSSFKWHKDPNPFTFAELGELGYKFIFITLFAAHAGMYAVWNAMEELVQGPGAGAVAAGEDQGRPSDREPPRDGPRQPISRSWRSGTSPAATSGSRARRATTTRGCTKTNSEGGFAPLPTVVACLSARSSLPPPRPDCRIAPAKPALGRARPYGLRRDVGVALGLVADQGDPAVLDDGDVGVDLSSCPPSGRAWRCCTDRGARCRRRRAAA